MKIGHSLEDWGCCVVSCFHQSLASGEFFADDLGDDSCGEHDL